VRLKLSVTCVRRLVVAVVVLAVLASAAAAQEPGGGRYDFAATISQHGLLWAILIAFGAGVLVSFTPCVYPMIPITIGIIGARGEDTTLRRSFGLAFTYVFGLVIVYSVLGLLVGLLGPQVRSVLMSPYMLIGVAAVFGLLALGMLGLYELQLPPSVATKLSAVGGRGVLGVLLMGMVSGLVASPCTAAPLAGILTFVAVQGNPATGFLLLFSFAWGMGLLLLVVGTSAGALTRLPKSGAWMVDVKHLFGFVFLAVAAYFVRTLIPEMVYLIAIAACVIAGGVTLGALDSLPLEPSAGQRLKKGLGLLLAVVGCYILLGTLWTKGVFLPERTAVSAPVAAATMGGAGAAAVPPLHWETDIDAAFAKASQEGRRVLMDWSADWCTVCKEMEKEAFTRPDVQKALSEYVLLRVDATELNAREQELADKYKFLSAPTLIVADGDGKLVGRMEGYENPEGVLDFLTRPDSATGEEPAGST
jgi:thiol:disulfide interchange protein DsbD